jgi:hypothetical protein
MQADAAAIWAFNMIPLNQHAAIHLRDIGCEGVPELPLDLPDFILDPQLTRGAPVVACGEPPKMNERMAAQQGMFLLPANIQRSFTENLFGSFGHNALPPPAEERLVQRAEDIGAAGDFPLVMKLTIPSSVRSEAMRDLQFMNITAATLYPGLDGFAKLLQTRLTLGDL